MTSEQPRAAVATRPDESWPGAGPAGPASAAPVSAELSRVVLAQFAVAAARQELRSAVREAREAGVAWSVIGRALGHDRALPSDEVGD